MHQKNQLFTNFHQQNSSQEDHICLVLTDFPSYIDLNQLKIAIQNDFSFVADIKVVNNVEIQCYFLSMTDLVDLDQGKSYGAGRAFIRKSQKMNHTINHLQNSDKKRVFLNSQQTFQPQKDYQLHSYKFIPELDDQLEDNQDRELFYDNPKLLHRPQMQRLTSLEDEIVELEQLREQLNLFKDECEHDKTFETEQLAQIDQHYTCNNKKISQKNTQDTLSEYSQNQEQQVLDKIREQTNQLDKKQIAIAVMQGAALTAIVYGGIKLLKNLLQ